MLFLLGIGKLHPVVRMLIGLAVIGAGIGLGSRPLVIPGAVLLVWGGYLWLRRSRTEARRQEAHAHKNGAVR
jgi:threonine/homoserine/homoserine lactone efflux protein